jgi:hypothetical protein
MTKGIVEEDHGCTNPIPMPTACIPECAQQRNSGYTSSNIAVSKNGHKFQNLLI